MKLIVPKVEIIPQEDGLLGVYKQIEIAGRTCYKSEDKITENSCKEFVCRMINNGHTAMLEHGSIYLKVPNEDCSEDYHEWVYMFPEDYSWVDIDGDGKFTYISTNYRHIIEKNVGNAILLKYLCAPTQYHNLRVSVRFICDRGIMAELTRHRVFSFAVESTRFCNYSKDKFNKEVSFILPTNIENGDVNVRSGIKDALSKSENLYMSLIALGIKPQDARCILPTCLKTEVVMTGFISDWRHFFDLRCAPNAHPDMQVLANQLKEQFKQNNYI